MDSTLDPSPSSGPGSAGIPTPDPSPPAFPPPASSPVTGPLGPSSDPPRARRSAGHVIALVVGVLALFPGLGLLAGGTAVAIAQATATDDGYFTYTPDRLRSDGVAIISDDPWLDEVDDAGPWVLGWLDLDVRLRASTDGDVFIGVAHTDDVEAYLDGSSYSVVDDLDDRRVTYREIDGDAIVPAPTDVDIWMASASGAGEQELTWQARAGRWAVVVMHADGTPALSADVELGARSDAVTPIAVTLIIVGGVTVLGSIALIVFGARGRRPGRR